MAGKPAVYSVAVTGHLLSKAPVSPAGSADRTIITWHYCRNNYFLSYHLFITGYDRTADFMPQCHRWLVYRWYSVVEITKVGMTYAAACNFNYHFSCLNFRHIETHSRQFPR